MNPEEWIDEKVRALRRQSAERTLRVVPEAGGVLRDVGTRCLNLSSNDYLNLSGHAGALAAAREALEGYGCGSGASRLVSGTLPIHEELEAALASWMGIPAALVFGSGFLANQGAVQSVVGRGDTVFADRLIHASIVDAMVGSRAAIKRFHHNDADHLGRLLTKTPGDGRKLIVTESVFSMDGDLSPLAEIVKLAEAHDALLMVDEAHALGVFGPRTRQIAPAECAGHRAGRCLAVSADHRRPVCPQPAKRALDRRRFQPGEFAGSQSGPGDGTV